MQLLGIRQVREIVPVARSCIYAWMHGPEEFPKPTRIGGRVFWDRAEVEAWAQAHLDKR